MIKLIVIIMVFALSSCAEVSHKNTELTKQKQIFKSWVLSRCLSYTFNDKRQKQDALNTASAYLEQSTLPVEKLLLSEPLIKKFLSKNYQGSIKGTFNTKKCIDLFNSHELDELYKNLKK